MDWRKSEIACSLAVIDPSIDDITTALSFMRGYKQTRITDFIQRILYNNASNSSEIQIRTFGR